MPKRRRRPAPSRSTSRTPSTPPDPTPDEAPGPPPPPPEPPSPPWLVRYVLGGAFAAGMGVLAWPYLGVGLFLLGGWVGSLAWAVRHRPRLLLRVGHRWLGALALGTALETALTLVDPRLGGLAGQRLAGPNLWQGVPLALGLTLAGVGLFFPRPTARLAWALAVALGRALRWALPRLGRGALGLARWVRRHPPHRPILALARGVGRGLRRSPRPTPSWADMPPPSPSTLPPFANGAQTPEEALLEPPDPTPSEDTALEDEEEPLPETVGPVVLEDREAQKRKQMGPRRVAGWVLPSTSLLQDVPEEPISEEENLQRARLIEETLASFGIEVRVQEIRPGPTVTQFGLVPGWVRRYREVKERDRDGRPRLDREGKPIVRQVEERTRVRVDAILAREKDLALALAAPSLRFEAPVPGEGFVGLEVPNPRPALVTLRSVMESQAFRDLARKEGLPIALGKGTGGEPVVADLTEMPHLLIAGTTGSGKSVCINAILVSLLLTQSPFHLRLVLVDPKRVELTPYNGLPHLVCPVITEPEEVVQALQGLIAEMGRRYKQLEQAGVRNIRAYNRRHGQDLALRMPYLVLVVDELADLMMTTGAEVEQGLTRLAQLARAVGIHLVVATQRPSVDVVTGLIKANFPSRIAFAVSSQVDSRTILDMAGAERLLGKGDMLFLPVHYPKPKRVQGVYIADEEVERVVEAWKAQKGDPPPPVDLSAPLDEEDGLLEKARALCAQHRSVSVSLLQRKLGIGYNRAVRLMERLEEEGLVEQGERGRARRVRSASAKVGEETEEA